MRRVAQWVVREVAPALRPIVTPVLSHCYQHALRIEDSTERNHLLRRLRWWRRRMYPPGSRVLRVAELEHGMRLCVNLCELEGGNLFFGLPFEQIESRILTEIIRPRDVFLDVGANVGFYTVLAARLVSSQGTVHAFEPSSFAYAMLLRNLRLNRTTNVVPNKAAVGDGGSQVEIFVNRESGLSSLGWTGRGKVVCKERVPYVSLDEYVDRRCIPRVNILKVDVEGFEGRVLSGARNLIDREPDLAILCELSLKNYRPLQLSRSAVTKWMRDRGYEVWEVDGAHGLLIRSEGTVVSDENQVFIFVRPGTTRYHAMVALAQQRRSPRSARAG